MEFKKTREVESPIRAHKTDAGIDFFVPTDLKIGAMIEKNPKTTIYDYIIDDFGTVKKIKLKPGKRILIPSGIYCKIPKNTALVAFNKSGVANDTGLVVGSCVVDEGYQGEVHISLINTSTDVCMINAGAKIVQFVLMKIDNKMPAEFDGSLDDFYKNSKSDRKDGGFGSTDKK
jgi:dUTP pyrophosphatase